LRYLSFIAVIEYQAVYGLTDVNAVVTLSKVIVRISPFDRVNQFAVVVQIIVLLLLE
jgi:hypothetical protein